MWLRRIGLIATMALWSAGANAAPAEGPKSNDDKDVAPWAAKHGLQVEGWRHVFTTEGIAFFLSYEAMPLEDWPVTRVWFRTEHLERNSKIASERLFYELDCSRQRHKQLAYSQFTQPNLKGEEKASAKIDDWQYPMPFSIQRDLTSHTCLIARFARVSQETN